MAKAKFNFTTPVITQRSTSEAMDRILVPYKLRTKASGDVGIFIKVPGIGADSMTMIVLRDGANLRWSGAGTHELDNDYEFLGPLGPNESITITGG